MHVLAERVEYLDENGKLVTEAVRDFSKKAVKKKYASLSTFLNRWNSEKRKQAIIDELMEEGLFLVFDLICHVAFDQPPLTRRARAEKVRKQNVFTKYGDQARKVLEALLQKYQDDGVLSLDDPRVLQIPPLNTLGPPIQLIKEFGDRSGFDKAVHELQDALYRKDAA